MKGSWRNVFIILILAMPGSFWASPALAGAVISGEDFKLHIDGFIQPSWLVQRLDDPFRDDTRFYHFLRRARLAIHGTWDDLRFRLEVNLSGTESEIPLSPAGRPTWGLNTTLLDFYADVPLPWVEGVFVRVGQFKVPFSRERITYSRWFLFAERSVVDRFFGLGRDYGGALLVRPEGPWSLVLAVQTGLGRNLPERFLPEDFGFPMVTLRVGYDGGVGPGLYEPALEPALDATPADRPKFALYLNGLYTKDTMAGHSTALNVRATDKPLLLHPSWNPYVNRYPLHLGRLTMIGGDFVVRAPVGTGRLSLEGELNYGRYDNDYGRVDTLGGRLQASLYWKAVEFGVRYAFVRPDPAFGSHLNPKVPEPIGERLIQEVTPTLVYYYRKHNAKLIVDVPVFIDAPVAVENGIGTYVLLQQPGQITYVTGAQNVLRRQTVVEVRALLQVGF